MSELAIVSGVVAEQYQYHMGQIADAVPEIMKRSVQLWRSVFEIYSHKLWTADSRGFHSQEEWIDSLAEDYHLARSTVLQRMSDAKTLIERSGVDRLVAIDAATLIPAAARKVAEVPAVAQGDGDAYLLELVALPPAEALARVTQDAGTRVAMWCADVRLLDHELLARIARSDGDGFKSFDVRIAVLESDWPELESAVLQWLQARLTKKSTRA